jgi:uncharacterized peroxidase-related enzyme
MPANRITVEAEPIIPYVAKDKMPKQLMGVLEPYEKRMGFVPNALKLYAHRPEIAETLWRLNSNVMRDPSSTLDQFLKRRLSALASVVNGCAYCTSHCCSMLKKPPGAGFEGWGLDDGDVRALLAEDYQPKDELERVCFDFVRAASEDPANVPDEIHQRLVKHLTPAQIVELACVVGFWKFYNTVHDALKIPVEATLIPDTKYVEA